MLQSRTMPPCRDCKQEWTFTVLEQALFVERNYGNDPSRCPECRENRQAARENGEMRGRNGRRQERSYEITCAGCGVKANLPFKPSQDRPAYCHDCHRKNRLAG